MQIKLKKGKFDRIEYSKLRRKKKDAGIEESTE